MRRSQRGTWPRTAACAPTSSGRRGDQHPRRPPARPVPGATHPLPQGTRLVHRGGPRPGWDRHPGAPAGAVPDVCPGLRAATPPCGRQPGRAARHDRDLQPHGAGQVPPRGGRPVCRGARPGAGRQQRRPHRIGDRRLLDDLSRSVARGLSPGRRIGPDGPPRRLPRVVRRAGRVRTPARSTRAGGRRRSGARCAATERAGIRVTPAAPCVRRATIPRWAGGGWWRVKIGLVSPYVYPLPGGVTQHVRFLYENLRLRGHEVRILTSSHGLQRSSEGDVIRLGKGFSMPSNGSVGTITLSPRYVSQAHDLLERERFDVLHFHEPFVPFLSLVLLNQSQSVNIGTFHAYGGWSPAYEFGARARPGSRTGCTGASRCRRAARALHRPLLPGRLQGHPQWRGLDAPRERRAADPLAGRHPEHPVRRPLRDAQGRPRPAQGLPDPAQDRLRLPAPARWRRAPGTRGTPLRGHASPPGGRVPRPRLG